jgi:hypothetical protein
MLQFELLLLRESARSDRLCCPSLQLENVSLSRISRALLGNHLSCLRSCASVRGSLL